MSSNLVQRRQKLKTKKAAGQASATRPVVGGPGQAADQPEAKRFKEEEAAKEGKGGGKGGGSGKDVFGRKASKWSGNQATVKSELKELYSAVGLCLKLHLQHGRDIRELQFRNGQTAIVLDKENEGLMRVMEAKDLFFTELKEAQEKARKEGKEPEIQGSVEADCFMEMLEWMSEAAEVDGDAELSKHLKEVTSALADYTNDEEALHDSVTTMRVQRAYGGRMKVIMVLNCSRDLIAAIHFFWSRAGGKVRRGKPPMTPLEKVVQSVLNDIK